MSGLDQQIAEHRAARLAEAPQAAYDRALVELQAELPIIERRQTAEVTTDKGRTYRYSFADLADITRLVQPLLTKHGFAFTARSQLREDGKLVLLCRLRHAPSGAFEESTFPLPEMKMAQSLGGWITYGRRYCLCAMAGIVTEDDDDAAAAEAEAGASRGTAQRATRAQQHQAAPTGGTGRPTAQRATRSRAADGPPLPGEDQPAAQRTSTNAQLQKMAILFGEIGVTERSERLALTSTLVGRPLGSGSELNLREASGLIERLEKAKTQDDPLGWLASTDDEGGES